jgi:aldose sugar dehydrogenase
MIRLTLSATFLLSFSLSAPLLAQAPNGGPPTKGQSADELDLVVTTVAKDLKNPWGVAFLPDGRFLVTEKKAVMKLLNKDGTLAKTLDGLPKIVFDGQAGLLDVVLHPDFKKNKRIYFTFSEPDASQPDMNSTAVAMARLDKDMLKDVKVIFSQQPKVKSNFHFGSRLAFQKAPGGKYYLFITTGERFMERARAQQTDSHIGKLIRLHDDGSIPKDNPFVGKAGARPEIFSIGHRNMQGMTVLSDGTLVTTEHGPKGGDELNTPKAGRNYGWPIITYGEEYQGGPVGDGLKAKEGMEQPVHYWLPSIGASGLAQLTSTAYGRWKGDIFAGALSHRQLVRLEMDGLKVKADHRLLGELNERIRDVRQGPDGKLYLLTDSPNGRLLRLDPK